ncbi:glycosyltransferase family 2 protein [Azospirillum sp.]|uniref:glycosyltransferase family 2 protein n=1 Tax=Azospirillum sp. TaxID=34012 RepID=UPI003D7486C8
MTDAPPTLSIVIPAYNVAAYIEQAVTSALDQSVRDCEVIVVDDGSTDATPAVLAALAEARGDTRLRIVRQENGGLSAARNTGIRHARSRYIGFLDGDDAWRPEKAERQLALMEADPRIGISFSHSEYMLEDGTLTGQFLVAEIERPSLRQMIRRNHVGNGSAPIVRRDCFEQAGVFRAELRSCEDYEMWCRILSATSFVAAAVPAPLTLYRLRGSSLCFAFDTFLENADRAVAFLRDTIPRMPDRVFDRGLAEHHRITAWKALTSGQTTASMRYLARAIRLNPWLLVSDRRAVVTLVAIAVRKSGSPGLQRAFDAMLASFKLRQGAGIAMRRTRQVPDAR